MELHITVTHKFAPEVLAALAGKPAPVREMSQKDVETAATEAKTPRRTRKTEETTDVAPAGPTLDQKQVIDAIKAAVKVAGEDAVRGAMKKFGAGRVTDLPQDKYAAFVAALEALSGGDLLS